MQNFSKKLMTRKQVSADELIAVIIKGIDDVKGENIQLLDLRDIENTVCDYFIICSGNSNTQVNAISGSVQKVVSKEIKIKTEIPKQPKPIVTLKGVRIIKSLFKI